MGFAGSMVAVKRGRKEGRKEDVCMRGCWRKMLLRGMGGGRGA